MPKAFGKLTCPCGGAEWVVWLNLEDDTLGELCCAKCGNKARLSLVLAESVTTPGKTG